MNPSVHGAIGDTSSISNLLDGDVLFVECLGKLSEAFVGNRGRVGGCHTCPIASSKGCKTGELASGVLINTWGLWLFGNVALILWDRDSPLLWCVDFGGVGDPKADRRPLLPEGFADGGESPSRVEEVPTAKLEV